MTNLQLAGNVFQMIQNVEQGKLIQVKFIRIERRCPEMTTEAKVWISFMHTPKHHTPV